MRRLTRRLRVPPADRAPVPQALEQVPGRAPAPLQATLAQGGGLRPGHAVDAQVIPESDRGKHFREYAHVHVADGFVRKRPQAKRNDGREVTIGWPE